MTMQHHVITYDVIAADGVTVLSTHVCFDSDFSSVIAPAGCSVRTRMVPSELPQEMTKEINYAAARSSEYPSVGDQLGVIWNVLRAHPEFMTSEARQMLARIDAVKGDLPKGKAFVLNLGEEEGSKYKERE